MWEYKDEFNKDLPTQFVYLVVTLPTHKKPHSLEVILPLAISFAVSLQNCDAWYDPIHWTESNWVKHKQPNLWYPENHTRARSFFPCPQIILRQFSEAAIHLERLHACLESHALYQKVKGQLTLRLYINLKQLPFTTRSSS